MIGRWRAGRRHEAGNVAIPFAVSLMLMLGLAALVIDLGHARVVKRELQKAAEAGALTGARALALDPAQPFPHLALTLKWDNGATQATTAVQNNYVNGALLNSFSATSTVTNPDGTITTIHNVEAGYCDVRWTMASAPANLNGYLDPAGYRLGTNGGPPNTNYEIPAVKVTITQTQGSTGGTAPMTTFFASVLGVNSMNMQASAVAILPSPTKINPGGLFPFALPQSYVKTHWSDNPPTSFTVGSAQHNSSGGQWTTFENTGQVGASTVAGYIQNGNDVAISVGDPVYIQSGEDNAAYKTVSDQLQAHPNQIYMVAVVADGFQAGASTTVLAFVPFKVTGADHGNNPYVSGQFVPGYMSPKGSGASGSYYGDPDRPQLVQ
jgi:hypothetical protein